MDKKTIGIVGGGQLCLMLGETIKNKDLPYNLVALDPTPNCPAYNFLGQQFVGDYKDETQIRRLAESSDIITFEIELANSQVLAELEERGMLVHPSSGTLRIIQDKYVQADFLRGHGIPVPDFQRVENQDNLERAIEEYGLPIMIKARTDSYDGKGNFVLRNQTDVSRVLSCFNGRNLMAQRYVDFDLEVSVISARGINGEISTFPVGENIHGADYNILKTTIVPARVDDEVVLKSRGVAEDTMRVLEGAGVFGIEMFVKDGDVLVNEIAPRVHNSGHYSIEACHTSQFEQHIRAIMGERLGNTNLTSGSVVMHNIIGGEGYTGSYQMMFERTPIIGTTQVADSVVVHNYGKHQVRPYRKMGHFTVVSLNGVTQDDLIHRAEQLKSKIKIERKK